MECGSLCCLVINQNALVSLNNSAVKMYLRPDRFLMFCFLSHVNVSNQHSNFYVKDHLTKYKRIQAIQVNPALCENSHPC